MANKITKDMQLAVRLAPDMRRVFINKAAPYGGTSLVLRELVRAFNENRLTIQLPQEGTLYDHN